MREHLAAIFEVGARHVDFDRDDRRRRVGQQLGRPFEFAHGATPDAGDDACTGAFERRKLVLEPRLDARALQADAVDHPRGRLVHTRWRIARPRLRRQRLDDDRAERRQIEVAGQFGAVPGRARSRHDRVRQCERSDARREIDGLVDTRGPRTTHQSSQPNCSARHTPR